MSTKIMELWIKYQTDKSVEQDLFLSYRNERAFQYIKWVILKKYQRYSDVIESGFAEGLLKSIRNFDYTKGVCFTTYAKIRIRGSIIDALREVKAITKTKKGGKGQEPLTTLFEEDVIYKDHSLDIVDARDTCELLVKSCRKRGKQLLIGLLQGKTMDRIAKENGVTPCLMSVVRKQTFNRLRETHSAR